MEFFSDKTISINDLSQWFPICAPHHSKGTAAHKKLVFSFYLFVSLMVFTAGHLSPKRTPLKKKFEN